VLKRGLQGVREKPRAGADHILAQREGQDVQAWIVPLDRIVPDPTQPRQVFNDETLQDLAADIGKRGIRSPLTVYREGDLFRLIAGERRYRAAKLLGLSDVPVRIIEADNILEEQIIENLQREDLNPVDEAEALHRLKETLNLSLRELENRIHKSKSSINRSLSILDMPETIREKLRLGELVFAEAERLSKPKTPPAPKQEVRSPPPVLYKPRKDGSFKLQVSYKAGEDKQQVIETLELVLSQLKNNP
jgi:ParB family transcriptional regulator, chromosome partitioning protein